MPFYVNGYSSVELTDGQNYSHFLASIDQQSTLTITQLPSGKCVYRDIVIDSKICTLGRVSWCPGWKGNRLKLVVGIDDKLIFYELMEVEGSDDGISVHKKEHCSIYQVLLAKQSGEHEAISNICHLNWITANSLIVGYINKARVSLAVAEIPGDTEDCVLISSKRLLFTDLPLQGGIVDDYLVNDVFETRFHFHAGRYFHGPFSYRNLITTLFS